MTLYVRDEEDIIRQNLDFHLSQGVDFFIITNNRSVDRTPEILADYERNGVAEVIFDNNNEYRQAEIVTRMARKAATRYSADWVINNDADEFWFGSNGSLKSVLKAVPKRIGALRVSRHQFAPPHPLHSGLPWWQSMIYRERQPRNYLGKRLPLKVCHRAHPQIEVGSGSHKASIANHDSPINVEKSLKVEIAHFPLRGLNRLEASLRSLEHIFRSKPLVQGQTPGAPQYKLFELLQEGRLNEFYEQRLPNLDPNGKHYSTDHYIEDVRIRDMIDNLGT